MASVERLFEVRFPGFPWDFAYCNPVSKPSAFQCGGCWRGWLDWDAPLRIGWDREAPRSIGDFTPLGHRSGSFLVSTRARSVIEKEFGMVKFDPVEEVGRVPRKQARPDSGPLWWLRPHRVRLPAGDYERLLGWQVEGIPCPKCGTISAWPPNWSSTVSAEDRAPMTVREEDLYGQPVIALDAPIRAICLRESLKDLIMCNHFCGIATVYLGSIAPVGKLGTQWW